MPIKQYKYKIVFSVLPIYLLHVKTGKINEKKK